MPCRAPWTRRAWPRVLKQKRSIMGKPKRRRLFGTKCPECGSKNTKINWMKAKNYQRAALTVIDPLLGAVAGRYDKICLDCHHKFAA